MTSSSFFYAVAITVVPIAIIGAGYYLLARFWRRGLSKAVHAGFGVTIAMLSVWGAYQLWFVSQGGGFSGLIMIYWMFFGLPVAFGCFFLVWSVVTLTKGRDTTTAGSPGLVRARKYFAIGFISFSVIAALGYFYRDYQLRVAKNHSVEPERLRALYNSRLAEIEIKVLRNLTLNKSTPVDVLQQLAVHEELWVRRNTCINKAAPLSVLTVMANDKAWQIRWCVARHPNASEELLAQLANDQSSDVRRSLAYSATVSPELLMKMSRDSSESVRAAVALNKNTPVAALVKMAADSSDNVRRLVAVRTDLPLKQRLQLAEDTSAEVRDALMHGGNTPIEVLNKLENDPDEKVRQSVKRRKLERKVAERKRR